MNDTTNAWTDNRPTIRAALIELMKNMPKGVQLTDIANEAVELAEVDVLTEINRLCGATAVTVSTETENSGEGGDFFSIEGFTLHLADGSTIELYDVDVQDAGSNEEFLREIGPRFGEGFEVDESEDPCFCDELIEKVETLYQLLNDLPRLRGIKGGETIYNLPG